MSKSLKLVRFHRTIPIGTAELMVYCGPNTTEGQRVGIKSLEAITDRDAGPCVALINRLGDLYLVPNANVNNMVIEPLIPAVERKL